MDEYRRASSAAVGPLPPTADGPHVPPSVAGAVSNRMVALFKRFSGRGPPRARTYVHGRLVVCVLESILTGGERALMARGESEAVVEARRACQRVIRPEASDAVEKLTGLPVVASFSDDHVDSDVSIHAFVLGPAHGADVGVPDRRG